MPAQLPRGIRKRGAKYFVDVSYKGRRLTATCDTELEARASQATFKAQLFNGIGQETSQETDGAWTLGKVFDLICEAAAPHGWRKAKAEVELVRNGQSVVSHFGRSVILKDICTSDIEGYANALERGGASDSTINRKLAALSRMFSFARERGGCSNNPVIPRRKEGRGRIRFLTKDEERDLVKGLVRLGYEEQAKAVQVLVDTGLRVGELLRLTEADVDFDTNMISVWVNKSDRPRSVPMTRRVGVILRDQMRRRMDKRLFPHHHAWLRYPWDKVRADLGFAHDKQFVPHVLRHTCASRLAQRGANIKVIKAWMGHTSITVTDRYMHLAPTDLGNAVALLEAAE